MTTILRSSVIGIFTGLIPGTGGDTACWFGYNEAKRFSKDNDKFGTGIPEGVAASEAANNAVVGGRTHPNHHFGNSGQLGYCHPDGRPHGAWNHAWTDLND